MPEDSGHSDFDLGTADLRSQVIPRGSKWPEVGPVNYRLLIDFTLETPK